MSWKLFSLALSVALAAVGIVLVVLNYEGNELAAALVIAVEAIYFLMLSNNS